MISIGFHRISSKFGLKNIENIETAVFREELEAAERLAAYRDMLRYVASQVACGGVEDKVWQKPFLKARGLISGPKSHENL